MIGNKWSQASLTSLESAVNIRAGSTTTMVMGNYVVLVDKYNEKGYVNKWCTERPWGRIQGRVVQRPIGLTKD